MRRQTRDPIMREFRRLRDLAQVGEETPPDPPLGLLTAFAYPERIARRRGGTIGRFLTAGGTGAVVPERSILAREEYLAIAEVDGAGMEAKIHLAAPLTRDELLGHFSDLVTRREEIFWDDRKASVVARSVQALGSVEISAVPVIPPPEKLRSATLEGIRRSGLSSLPWDNEGEALRARSEWLRAFLPAGTGWPDLSDSGLAGTLDAWLGPFVEGMSSKSQWDRIPLARALRGLLTHRQAAELDRLAPAFWITPAGTRVALQYTPGAAPVAAVRLQEMFGQRDTPLIAGGKARITIHLLSPAGRPLAITQDLRSFWLQVYPTVRKEMRGRYPKHLWPEDPLSAKPTRRTLKRR
jgi:ATP-dependent helicase HrpB